MFINLISIAGAPTQPFLAVMHNGFGDNHLGRCGDHAPHNVRLCNEAQNGPSDLRRCVGRENLFNMHRRLTYKAPRLLSKISHIVAPYAGLLLQRGRAGPMLTSIEISGGNPHVMPI